MAILFIYFSLHVRSSDGLRSLFRLRTSVVVRLLLTVSGRVVCGLSLSQDTEVLCDKVCGLWGVRNTDTKQHRTEND